MSHTGHIQSGEVGSHRPVKRRADAVRVLAEEIDNTGLFNEATGDTTLITIIPSNYPIDYGLIGQKVCSLALSVLSNKDILWAQRISI